MSQENKRQTILQAALSVFIQYGYRRTSMEDIARSAGVSRASLYLQFKNKQEIFRTLSQQLHDDAIARAKTALNRKGKLKDRLLAAVEEKNKDYELIYGSAHGSDLIEANDSIASDITEKATETFKVMLVENSIAAEKKQEIDLKSLNITAEEFAELLLAALKGIKSPPPTPEIYRSRTKNIIEIFMKAIAPF